MDFVRSGRTRWSFGVALVAAWLLVLQSMVGAPALSASSAQLDSFGNVLCTTHGIKTVPGGDTGHTPDCCFLGCAAFGTALATPPEAGALLASLSFEAEKLVLASDQFLDRLRGRTPANPRAPPLYA